MPDLRSRQRRFRGRISFIQNLIFNLNYSFESLDVYNEKRLPRKTAAGGFNMRETQRRFLRPLARMTKAAKFFSAAFDKLYLNVRKSFSRFISFSARCSAYY